MAAGEESASATLESHREALFAQDDDPGTAIVARQLGLFTPFEEQVDVIPGLLGELREPPGERTGLDRVECHAAILAQRSTTARRPPDDRSASECAPIIAA